MSRISTPKLFLAVLLCCIGIVSPTHTVAQTSAPVPPPGPEQRLAELKQANSITHEGVRPWHIRMSFQLFDLKGKPKETGTIESWWVAPGKFRTVVASPSYNHTTPSTIKDSPGDERTGYLADLLLKQATDPIPAYKAANGLHFEETTRKFDAVTLSCIVVLQGQERISDLKQDPQVCTEPGKQVLRVAFDSGDLSLIRNKMATFQKMNLALDNVVNYGAHTAISGRVEALETFDQEKNPVELTNRPTGEQLVPAIVQRGSILKKVTPVYPSYARTEGIQGSVILLALIGTDGHVTNLHVIASPDSVLSDSAINAVKQWEYSPYLLNGVPQVVHTTITVNFNFGVRR